MFVVPAERVVTTPLFPSTDATEALLLIHDPPPSPSLVYVAVCPMQSGEVPLTVPAFEMLATLRFFEDETGALQPLLTVYIISVVPAPTAVTSPVVAFTIATEVLLLFHVPPASPSLE